MDKIFASATSVKEKLKALEQSYKVLNYQEIEGVYKHIHTLGEDSLVLLDQAQKFNFGNIFNDLQLFKRVSESIRELDQICMYLKYIDKNYGQKAYLKELGFQSEKLIMEFRQKGNILQKMHLDTQDLSIQRQMIEMIIKLCPKDLSFNPELFQLMLIPFKCLQQQNPKDIELLDSLASVLLQQCNGQGQANQNQVHDWLALISGVVQHAYEGNTLGLHILLKKIPQDYLSELLIRHKTYMLDNYFKNSQDTIKIFQGLVSHTICQEAIFIIKTVSQMFYNIVKDQNDGCYLVILKEVYKEFILTKILENLQIIGLTLDILDLLLFYIIGMSSIDQEPFIRSIKLMTIKLTIIASLRFVTRDFITPRYQFLQLIEQNYNSLNQIEEFQKIYIFFKDRSFEQNKITQLSKYQPWEFQNLKNQSTLNQSLQQQRDSKDFVGLENLTNTCFMNSILQSLYMTESFRKFVLQMQFPNQTLQLTPQTSLWSCLKKLFTQLTYQNQGYCSPYELKRSLRQPYCNTNDQQDVGEFVHHFLEDLFDVTPNEAFKITIGNLFFGYQRQIIKCYNCVKSQPNYGQKEKFLGIDLHFNKLNDIDIISMIKKTYEEEQIEFTCERCRQKTNKIYKSQQLLQLPSVLFMTLHRFTYDQNSQTMTKILDKVPFQFQIDFREAFPNKHLNSQDSVYNLYAFIVHLGKNSYSGHYICYARQLNKPDTWIAFDDTMISTFQYNSKQLDQELIVEEAPYLLFYQNQSGQPLIFNN